MIMNRLYGAGGAPFSSVNTVTLGTGFYPRGLSYAQDTWLIVGNEGTGSSAACLAQSSDGTTFKTSKFSRFSQTVRSAGVTDSGYLILASITNSVIAGYAQKSLSTLAEGSDTTRFTVYSPSIGGRGEDVVVNGNQVYVPGYGTIYSSGAYYYGINSYASAMPSLSSTGSDSWSSSVDPQGYPARATIRGDRPIAVSTRGIVGWKVSVGAQYMNGYSQVRSALDALYTTAICYCGGYVVVAGYITQGADEGTYIWYAPNVSNNMTWTEKKISTTAAPVKGIAYLDDRWVACYQQSGSAPKFWVSRTANIGATLVTDYTNGRFSAIASDSAVEMRGNGNAIMLVSNNGNTVHATKIM